jgi:glycosyltransferase involved in cell wall biosynthesis
MKIVLATHHFPPQYKAGAEQYAYRLAHSLIDRGHQVSVVCIESIHDGNLEPVHKLDNYEGIPVHRLYLDLFRENEPLRRTYDNPDIGAWFRKYLIENRPDLVHINSGYLLTASVPQAAYTLGIPVVITLHDYWFLCPRINLIRADGRLCAEPVEAARCAWCLLETKRRFREPDRLMGGRLGDAVVELGKNRAIARITGLAKPITAMEERRSFLKQVLEKADAVVCPSYFIMEKVEEYGFPSHNLIYLPFGLDVAEPVSSEKNGTPNKLRFGYMGQLAPHKGVHTLLQAFIETGFGPADAELIIYGDLTREPGYVKRLRALAGDNLQITFAGPYTNQEVGRVLDSLDILVVPSEWFENRPTVIVEAFAHGVPVIASNIGGIPELIQEKENGLLFEPGNTGSLAIKMKQLLEDRSLLPALIEGIRPIKTASQEIDELEGVYQIVMVNRKSIVRESEKEY